MFVNLFYYVYICLLQSIQTFSVDDFFKSHQILIHRLFSFKTTHDIINKDTYLALSIWLIAVGVLGICYNTIQII